MGGIVDKAIEVGTLGIVKDASGTKAAQKAAYNAAARQGALLAEGSRTGIANLNDNFDPAMQYMKDGFSGAQQQLVDGFNPALSSVQGGFNDARDAIDLNFNQATGRYEQGFGQAIAGLNNAQQGIEAPMQGFYDEGAGASQYQAALSGALGPQAQAQAFASYQESPEVAYMREMGEKAALRGASSQGMSLSGNVLAELNRRGTGLAMQDFGNSMARLGSIANRGQMAGNAISGSRSNLASNIANLQAQLGQGLAGMQTQYGNSLAGLSTNQGNTVASMYQNQANNLANLQSGQGQALAGAQLAHGQNLANIATGNAAQQAQVQGELGVAQGNAALANGQMGYQLLGTGIGALLGGA